MLDSIPHEYVTYVVLLFNTIIFHILRKGLLFVTPAGFKIVIAEIIATLELCADCAELGVAYEVHGYIGLGTGLLFLCFWWCAVWGDAEACPCGPVEECIFGTGFDAEVLKKLIGQSIGGAMVTFWMRYIWSFHMTPEHESLHTAAECYAGLQVHMALGALIEGLITLISRVVALESSYWTPQLSISANAIVTTILVLAATSTTGGFFNPVLATALTLGCKGNTVVEHFVVYWLGSFLGGFIGRYIYQLMHRAEKLKDL